MGWLLDVLAETWGLFFLAAPFILLGLFLAGLLQLLLSTRQVVRWLGGVGLSSVAKAAALGIPLPVCSCGVIPIAIALRRKGASSPASLSVIISAPESSVESIALTWGLLGPIMAVARPVAAFLTGGLAGVFAIAADAGGEAPDAGTSSGGSSGTAFSVSSGGAGEAKTASHLEDEDYIGPRLFWRSLREWFSSGGRRQAEKAPVPGEGELPSETPSPPTLPIGEIGRRIAHRALTRSLDEIAFWLVIGLLVAGALAAAIPDDLIGTGLGSGLIPMLLLLLVAIPIYSCAVESTPIAAALIAKGFSPGAALVFLLAGPAVNAPSILLVARHFGSKVLRVYLLSVVVGSLILGLLLDALLGVLGWHVQSHLTAAKAWPVALIQIVCGLVLGSLIGWRLWKGAARRGWEDIRSTWSVVSSATGLSRARLRDRLRRPAYRRSLILGGFGAALAVYLATGFVSIPPDSLGYGRVFGKVVRKDLAPGLHWNPPAPIGGCDVWRVHYPRKCDVGYRTDLRMLANRRQLQLEAAGETWHSMVTAMNADPSLTSYLTGDENLVQMSFTVHYFLSDPYAYFYRVHMNLDLVSLYAQATARELVAGSRLDSLLTRNRGWLESSIHTELQRRLDRAGTGVRVASVHIVDIHPPQEAVFAFRDVSSAREEKETRIHQAHAVHAREIPRARGEAQLEVSRAQAGADSVLAVAEGESKALELRAAAWERHPAILHDQLWLECSERVLAGREKFVVPPGTAPSGVILWKLPPAIPPSEKP
jgi:uncharacterized membrane protein YraQ (UPF0718 family)/regulator of protease activity HflC (stomatin/prohibitin superfamily)